jgi:hypothetical protein
MMPFLQHLKVWSIFATHSEGFASMSGGIGGMSMKLQGSVIFAAEDFSTMERCEGKRMELRTFVIL